MYGDCCLKLMYNIDIFAALHMASANGHLDVVEYLIGRGVVRQSFSFILTPTVFHF